MAVDYPLMVKTFLGKLRTTEVIKIAGVEPKNELIHLCFFNDFAYFLGTSNSRNVSRNIEHHFHLWCNSSRYIFHDIIFMV